MAILPGLPVPSTAATTSRLGLMNPADSDLFKSSDFASTFQIQDAVPGTLPVANLAALNALTWTAAQHGTRVLQLDNGAEWYWYQPSGAGVWKRTNAVGLITYATQGADVTTTSQAIPGVTFVQTTTFTAPGVRTLRVDLRVGLDNTTGTNSIVIVTLYDNGVQITDLNVRPGLKINANGSQSFHSAIFITSPTAGSSHQISAKMRSATASVAFGGQGTSGARGAVLAVTEI